MSKRVLIVAATTGYQTRSFVEAAKRTGIEVTLATDRCHVLDDPWGDHAIPIRFENPEIAAEVAAATGPVDGVVGLGDRAAYIASLAAERLGVPFHPPRAVEACNSKFLLKERFQKAGLPVPGYRLIPLADDPGEAARATTYPCVLKPLSLSASRGVIRANDAGEFVAAFHRIAAILRGRGESLLVEDFIEGREFALEGIMTNGRLGVLAIFDKPDPLDGPFFEETIYVTPSREDARTQQDIVVAAEKAVNALGLWHGPVHAEMRVNSSGVWMLEVAARPIGGLCAKVLPGLEELILHHLVAKNTSKVGKNMPKTIPKTSAHGVMMIPIPREGVYVSVAGIESANAVPWIEDTIVTAKEGQKLVPLPEGNSYLGFIFAKADTPEQVEFALREAHSKLNFEILTALKVV